MQSSLKLFVTPRLIMAKKHDEVDKGTTRETPGNNEGARPPKKEDFEKIHEENQKEKKEIKGDPKNNKVQRD